METATQVQTAPIREFHEEAPQKEGVKGGPVIFWLVAGIAVAKDILDIFTSILELIGLGLQVIPVIGTAVGIAIGGASLGLSVVSSMFVDFIMLTYFTYIGGSVSRRLVVMSIGAIMEFIPGLSILPMTTIMFFLAYFVGKIKIIKAVASLNPAARRAYALASKL